MAQAAGTWQLDY